jgi:PAT family beta-lactamase induction signal transducer AmpG
MTQKRFSATQYALFSSLFGLPRIVAGPFAGVLVDAIGWTTFFWFTMVCGIPGMILLWRFVPLGVREPRFVVEHPRHRAPLSNSQLLGRGLIGGIVGAGLGALFIAILSALKTTRTDVHAGFDLTGSFNALFHPAGVGDWVQLLGIAAFGVVSGLLTAAVVAARSGADFDIDADTSPQSE